MLHVFVQWHCDLFEVNSLMYILYSACTGQNLMANSRKTLWSQQQEHWSLAPILTIAFIHSSSTAQKCSLQLFYSLQYIKRYLPCFSYSDMNCHYFCDHTLCLHLVFLKWWKFVVFVCCASKCRCSTSCFLWFLTVSGHCKQFLEFGKTSKAFQRPCIRFAQSCIKNKIQSTSNLLIHALLFCI